MVMPFFTFVFIIIILVSLCYLTFLRRLFHTCSDLEEVQANTDATDPSITPSFTDSNGDGVSDAVDKALMDN